MQIKRRVGRAVLAAAVAVVASGLGGCGSVGKVIGEGIAANLQETHGPAQANTDARLKPTPPRR